MTYHLDERKSFWTRKKLAKGHKVYSWWHGTLWEGRVDHFGKKASQGQRVFVLVTKPAAHQPVHDRRVAVG
jgi:hypothetical protein